MNSENLIRGYFQCWLDNNRPGARARLNDKFKFRSPQDIFDDADTFLAHFGKMDILHEVYDQNAGYIIYTDGNFCAGELIKMEDNQDYRNLCDH